MDTLTQLEKNMLAVFCASNGTEIIDCLEKAISREPFESIEKLDLAIQMMGKEPREYWSRLNDTSSKKTTGRPYNAKFQLSKLFERRNIIVHTADLNTAKNARQDFLILAYPTVKRWLEYSAKAINKLEALFTE
jgi:hypothetical protein